MSEATAIIRRYIELVGAHDTAALSDLFDDDFVATMAVGTFTKSEWIAALERLMPVLVRNDIREVFDGDDPSRTSATAAVFYDFVTDTDAGAVPCAEWITTRGGKITTTELIFEKENWAHVVTALKERAGRDRTE
jgi:ketosteroid isomerase-like protein